MVAAAPAQRKPVAAPPPVKAWQDTIVLPTYEEGLPDPNPPFDLFVTSRFNYPYTLRQNLTDRRVSRLWRALHLENEYLACTVLPDLGGHLYRCIDKLNGADLFYANPSIKFARIAYRGAWTALGIEFNFPVSHNWMTASPVDFAITRDSDGSASAWIGNIDRAYGMQWRVALTLRPGRAVLEQHTTLYNRADTRHRFYWWTNAGVEVKDDSRILYPMRFTASHGFGDVDTWPVNAAGVDLSVVGNHTFGPVSRFAHGSREAFMAVYHPRTDAGIVHYSSPTDLPAKKIWSWGSDQDGLDWRRALSDNNSAYVEVQAGLFRNQETYAFLEPQQVIRFTEYWLPIRKIGGVSRANPDAAINMTRGTGADAGTLTVRLNVTRALPGGTVTVDEGTRHLSSSTLSLSPSTVFERRYSGARPLTVTVRDTSGHIVIQHTEDQYDYAPEAEIKTGAQAPYRFPPPETRAEGDFTAIGSQQELDGQLLLALDTYKAGLRRFPDSLELNRAAGRLAVTLKQYEFADACLSKVVSRATTDYESAYYLALAASWQGQDRRARTLLEAAQQFGALRPAALLALAAWESRRGDRQTALATLQRLTGDEAESVRAGGLEVALLRTLKKIPEARGALDRWLHRDPTSSFLRYEASRLGVPDPTRFDLAAHLAADPERIIEIAADYMRFGLFEDAVAILSPASDKTAGAPPKAVAASRPAPPAGPTISEPGMPRPGEYPLIGYYRAYCRAQLHQADAPDLQAASAMPTTYVFPNRPDTLPVLQHAIQVNPRDATAHFLLGSLYLSGGLADRALQSWETARQINPRIPTLHRNMGTTILQTGGSQDRAVELLLEGTRMDADNVGLYEVLEQAMTKAGRPAEERARAILAFPDQKALPTGLVFKLTTALAEAGRFDEAEAQLRGRFFAREEGGVNVRQVYLEVRARRAAALAASGNCGEAMSVINGLTRPVPDLAFTRDGLEPFLKRGVGGDLVAKVRAGCASR